MFVGGFAELFEPLGFGDYDVALAVIGLFLLFAEAEEALFCWVHHQLTETVIFVIEEKS